MEGSVAANVGEVTSTGSQGYQQEMNLRSVFTVDQQRILQRYYDNGMTNQSKGCFQLILQCAQETKLDFSVVRTWVGNKRRKMSSKNYTESSTQLQASMPNSPSRPSEAAVRIVPNLSRNVPPRTTSSNDFIMTCAYSPSNSSGRAGISPQTTTKADLLKPSMPRPPVKNDPEYLKLQALPPPRPAPMVKNTMDEKTLMLSRSSSATNPPNSLYVKKNFGGSPAPVMDRMAPQKATSWSIKSVTDLPGGHRPHKPDQPSISPVLHVSAGQRNRDSSCGLKNVEIREVFSLAASENSSWSLTSGAADEKFRPVESNCFSIAMETGDVDEYTREEELASLAAQNQLCSRFRDCNSSPHAENQCAISPVSVRTGNAKILPANARDAPENTAYHSSDYYMALNTSVHNTNNVQYPAGNTSRNSAHRHYNIHPPQGALLLNQNNYQISGNLSVPWITECSRKRTLQDRTQFSDHDLAMLKKYWDNGMTSLGSVCREKIEAVAADLNVDCEIVRTWIGNRRRKYRLMGIEVPPPRGGPATFPEHQDSASSLTPTEDPVAGVVEESDRNDAVSICLSEESSQADEMPDVGRNDDVMIKEDSPSGVPQHNVKVEAVDEEERDATSQYNVDQLRSLLEYRNEEARYMEAELETYKHKYTELQVYARNLIHAIRSNDIEQQKILLNEPPAELDDMDFSHASPEQDDTSYSMSSVSEKNNPDSV
ncbi:highly divergent homeobox isoform X2 [Hyperolius riggenbachi]|uniref:highly divergent homeobox isoform X2 n=1 Tax=Hyperolius riggenbachi TaxID=752182 RepID=UPI0035A3AE1B